MCLDRIIPDICYKMMKVVKPALTQSLKVVQKDLITSHGTWTITGRSESVSPARVINDSVSTERELRLRIE